MGFRNLGWQWFGTSSQHMAVPLQRCRRAPRTNGGNLWEKNGAATEAAFQCRVAADDERPIAKPCGNFPKDNEFRKVDGVGESQIV